MIRALGRIRRIKPNAQEVNRQLIGDACLSVWKRRQVCQIRLAQLPQVVGVECPDERRKRERLAACVRHHADNTIEIRLFTGGVDLWVAGQNLLDERAAGAGHADDEDRCLRGIAHPAEAIEQRTVVQFGGEPKISLLGCFIVMDLAAFEGIALEQMFEGARVVAVSSSALPSAKWIYSRSPGGKRSGSAASASSAARSGSPGRKVFRFARL